MVVCLYGLFHLILVEFVEYYSNIIELYKLSVFQKKLLFLIQKAMLKKIVISIL